MYFYLCLTNLIKKFVVESNAKTPAPAYPKGFSNHSLGTRYVRPFWIDDWATQKVLVGDPSPSPKKTTSASNFSTTFLQARKYKLQQVMIEQQRVELDKAKHMIEK